MATTKKQNAQGQGRTSNSEPRVQVFRDFAGCNFQESPRDFTLGWDTNTPEQSDMQMNYVVIQNNASIASNKTIATRSNLQTLFTAPEGKQFTDASILVADEFYIACEDGSILYGNLGEELENEVKLTNMTDTEHHWEDFAYVDDQIVGTTLENNVWTGWLGDHEMSNAVYVPDPEKFDLAMSAQEGLDIVYEYGEDHPYRISVAYSYVNKFGPTMVSPVLTFYANHPVSEWHSECFMHFAGEVDPAYGIQALEFYYTVDNSSSLLLAGRADIMEDNKWEFNWFGYLDATSMWPIANLIAPEENYTEGVPASRIECIDGRVYFWGDKENAYRLYIGGNPGNLLSVSPGTGGGFVDVEPGTGQEIRYVCKYKTQSGASIVTMLCDSKNSRQEQRFNLVENTVTISNEQNMKSWQAEQVAGAVGCKSYHGGYVCEDGLYSVSRYGLALTTQTMEYNSQIRANYVSDPIKPVFIDRYGINLSNSVLIEVDGIIYMCFGKNDTELDNILFCYDIDQKAWWTYTLDVDEPIIDMVHIDYEMYQEGIGIVTTNHVYLLPTTMEDDPSVLPTFETLIETGELSAQKPEQGWLYVSQLEIRFDHFIGDLVFDVVCIDQFGRRIVTTKHIHHDEVVYDSAEYIRIDLRVQCYKIIIHGEANFRMTHFMAKVYTMSNKQGLVWGFDDSQSYRTFGDIHPTFKSYNDIRLAIIP